MVDLVRFSKKKTFYFIRSF